MTKYINDDLRFAIENAQSFKDALSILDGIPQYIELFRNPVIDKLSEVETALLKGVFDEELSIRLRDLYKQIEEKQVLIETLGNKLIQPRYYKDISEASLAVSSVLDAIDTKKAMENMAVGLSSFSSAMDTVNISWIYNNNLWDVSKTYVSAVDTSVLGTGELSKLVKLEHQTSLLPGLMKLPSAASQIVSIQEALGSQIQLSRLLTDYVEFAVNQHAAIHKKCNDAELAWRLDALDVASKLVDRQIKWSEAIFDAVPIDIESVEKEDGSLQEGHPSVISMLPQYIAYTKRKNEDTTPKEALENSALVKITETGKNISEKIVLINKLCEDRGETRIFKYTDKTVIGMVDISTVVCSSSEQMGKIVDILYFIFYENLERIKLFIGQGNKKLGDKKVKEEDIYQCIFNIKMIRSDLRHDLDHGDEKDIRKKLISIGDCYQHYCKKRPIKVKDYKLLQLKLYDELIELLDFLIEMF